MLDNARLKDVAAAPAARREAVAAARAGLVRRRFGSRRLHIAIGREGIVMNHKKLRRLYREERLQGRRHGGHYGRQQTYR